jgi:predicted dehydrogenase
MERRLEAAVVGLGVGEQHARTYAASPRSRLRWLHDLAPERAQRVLSELGQGQVAESFESILADPAVDVVSLCSYDDHHAPQVVAALRAHKNVFCEKPLCQTQEELGLIASALALSPRRHLACNLVLRAAPLYAWLRQAIAAGELGEIYAVDGDYLYGRLHKIVEGWRSEAEGYSVFLGGGIHLLDLLLWLTGQRPVAVQALGNRIVTRDTGFRYPDYVAATYRFESGLVGRITANFGCVHRHQHVLRVFGSKATVIHDDQGARIHHSRDPDARATPLPHQPQPASKGDLIPGFLAAIAAGDPQDARHELDLMAAGLAAERALATSQPQAIEYLT